MSRKRHAITEGALPEQDPRFVTALARGLLLLRVFQPQEHWISHRELVQRTSLPSATVSRLSFTLTSLGYLRHRQETGEYALSPAVLALGFSMLSNFEIGRIARPHMQALADKCQAAVSLGARHGLSMVYVAHYRSAAMLTLSLDVGAKIPLAITAMGRAVFCAMPPHDQTAIEHELKRSDPSAWPNLAKRLQESRDQFARSGFISVESEWEPGVSAVGVPLDLGDGRSLFGLTVGGPSSRLMSESLHSFVGPQLALSAQEILTEIHAADWDI